MRTVFLATRTFIIAIGNENGPDIIDTVLVFFLMNIRFTLKPHHFLPGGWKEWKRMFTQKAVHEYL